MYAKLKNWETTLTYCIHGSRTHHIVVNLLMVEEIVGLVGHNVADICFGHFAMQDQDYPVDQLWTRGLIHSFESRKAWMPLYVVILPYIGLQRNDRWWYKIQWGSTSKLSCYDW